MHVENHRLFKSVNMWNIEDNDILWFEESILVKCAMLGTESCNCNKTMSHSSV